MVNCDNAPAIVAYSGDHHRGVDVVEIIDSKITNLYAIRNPGKLGEMTVPRQISR
jgi:RNA polymerase sigma-70 factor, ECF subfamily